MTTSRDLLKTSPTHFLAPDHHGLKILEERGIKDGHPESENGLQSLSDDPWARNNTAQHRVLLILSNTKQ